MSLQDKIQSIKTIINLVADVIPQLVTIITKVISLLSETKGE